jgi:hypothetical protein
MSEKRRIAGELAGGAVLPALELEIISQSLPSGISVNSGSKLLKVHIDTIE